VPVFRLTKDLAFPPPALATEDGLLAVGGDFRPERLVLAYAQGIFPWPMRGQPLLWFSPDPRFVLLPERLHVGRSLAKVMRRGAFEVRADTSFDKVVQACATAPRPGQHGTWITQQLRLGYQELHRAGFAHSIEAWEAGELVGGLYGVSLGSAFFGESMFARSADASKVAFATLIGNLLEWGFDLVDCQVRTEHLARFGADDMPRPEFLDRLARAIARATRRAPWTLPLGPAAALDRLEQSRGPAAT
jgi:leucyl/phenylalanyl-tRNA--protein transferase